LKQLIKSLLQLIKWSVVRLEHEYQNLNDSEVVVITSLEWERLRDAATATPPHLVEARAYRRSYSTLTKPVLLECADGMEYVVKGSQGGRSVFNEQVIGRLGTALGVPVCEVSLVNISRELIERNKPAMDHIAPGLAHGCRFVPDCLGAVQITHVREPANRERYAQLALFYGWIVARYHQFIYKAKPPHNVYSCDHGEFFPRGPDWTEVSLAEAPPASPDSLIVTACGLGRNEISMARPLFDSLNPEVIATAIAAIPRDWGGVIDRERYALACYLLFRSETLRA